MGPRVLFFACVFCVIVRVSIAGPRESISECDHDKKVPYRAIVKEDGTVEISCRFVDCVNASKENPVRIFLYPLLSDSSVTLWA